jgi:UDP-2,3-diacylglucosamine pyrophosphatase LpxH
MAKKNGCYGVICGHIHQPANDITDEGHYLNSGDWVENKTAILIDSSYKITIFGL